ncbi:MAG: hypothetical protein ABIK73_06040 [candidate division WOR-3 bacterium]
MKMQIEYYDYKTMSKREEIYEINAYVVYDSNLLTLVSKNFEMTHKRYGGIYIKDEIVLERLDSHYRVHGECDGVHYDGLQDTFRIKLNNNQSELYRVLSEAVREQTKTNTK